MSANSIPPSNIGIAAINLGFGWAKISLDGVEEKFMSAVSPQHRSVAMMTAKSKNQLNLVHLDGEFFEVGIEAAVDALLEPMRLISRHWGRSQKYKILAQAILNRMAHTARKTGESSLDSLQIITRTSSTAAKWWRFGVVPMAFITRLTAASKFFP
jgi:hypothetical protein